MLELNDLIIEAVDAAFDDGQYITVAYNGDDGWPHVSRRGSTKVYGPQELAIWVRKLDDGLARALERDPKITLFYADIANRIQLLAFYGRGRLSNDPEVAERVWAKVPEREKAQDPERKGGAVIVEIDRVVASGAKPEGNFVLER